MIFLILLDKFTTVTSFHRCFLSTKNTQSADCGKIIVKVVFDSPFCYF
nr:MAG TPA: hypothetical protein [Bacteriophage sp.]DAR80052.1 MAG TPA: hypothetical protein [Caudoviricetes sp.]DAV09429.1 MAG TPA: hypothetical protein [Caudoviricetes sp.]